jgi:hypothetical protein
MGINGEFLRLAMDIVMRGDSNKAYDKTVFRIRKFLGLQDPEPSVSNKRKILEKH